MNAIGQRTGVAISDRAHQYDAIGNHQKTANSLTLPVADNYTANALNQYTSFSSVASYDLFGNITRKALPNGTATQSTFDALSRKLTETTRTAGGGLISSFDYSQATAGYPSSYDKGGSLLKIVEFYGRADVKARTVTNTYDHTYRLATETAAEVGGTTVTSTYGYDKNNNRTSKIVTGGSNPGTWTSVYGTTADGYNSNQLKTVTKGGVLTTFQYDANGNRSTKQVGGAMVQGYVFDFENRLITLADLTKGSFGYTYDHRTRRVGRDELGGTGVPAASVKISFSGGLSVQEYTAGTGTPNVETIRGSDYGGGIGGVLYTIRSGARSYNAYNSRGDVVSKTDGGASITWQSSYEAFGTRTQEQGTTADRQKANTKDEDPTGLLNEGFRYRDLETGVFITRDPMGFVDGPNLYTYVRQNPWTKFDPEGLNEVVVSGGINDRKKEKIHDNNPRNFITAAKVDISQRKQYGKQKEEIEWLVERSTYEARGGQKLLDEINETSIELGVKLRWYSNTKELGEAINFEGANGKKRSGATLITDFTYFGHGYPGKMATKFEEPDGIVTNEMLRNGWVDRSAFAPGARAVSCACNSTTPTYTNQSKLSLPNGPSFAKTWKDSTGVPMVGLVGRSDYGPTAVSKMDSFQGKIQKLPISGYQNWGPGGADGRGKDGGADHSYLDTSPR